MRLNWNAARGSLRCAIALAPLLFAAVGSAQPSGGPYGPIDQTYEVPNAAHVYFVAPDGKAEAAGTLEQPTTIENAIAKVVTGDAIILRGGVYRTGGLELNQGVTIQPYKAERPILKGTKIPANWQTLRGNLWRTKWTTLYPAEPLAWWNRAGEGARTPLHRFNNDMVFYDGRYLQSAGWPGEVGPDSYYIDYKDGYVYIGANPANHLVEITAWDSALIRTPKDVHGKTNDHKGPAIRGITFTQYAYRALEVEGKRRFGQNEEPTDDPVGLQNPANFGKEVIGTLIENCTISFTSRVAGYFRGDGLIIRNSLISDTGTEGIYVIGSSDVLIEKNIIRRNNIENITGYYSSAVKIFNQTRRVTFRDNYVVDHPTSNGVWYDVGNRDGVFVNNLIERVQDGLFFEISDGITVAGNVFMQGNSGVHILNSANAKIYNNTFVDMNALIERNGRSATGDLFAWHPSTGPDVNKREGHIFVNNLVALSNTARPLLRIEQPGNLCQTLKNPEVTQVSGNAYARPTATGEAPTALLTFAPVAGENCTVRANTLEDFQKAVPAFNTNAQFFDLGPRAIFKSPDASRFELQKPITLPQGSAVMPEAVRKLLGWTEEQARTVGAFPKK